MKTLAPFFARLRSFAFFHYGKRLRATRDWLLVLAAALLIFLGSVAYNVTVFLDVTRGDILGGDGTLEQVTAPPLDDVHMLFEERAFEAARYESEYRFVDPSL